MPRFIVTMEDAEVFAPSQLARLQIVQNEIDRVTMLSKHLSK